MNLQPEKFDQWAIVELFGHQRIAGRVSEQTIGGCAFVRVDVPALDNPIEGKPSIPGFTKLYGQGAIYAMTFVDEATSRFTAGQLKIQPIDTWAMEQAIKAMNPERVQRLIEPPMVAPAPGYAVESDDDIPL
ncbi:hypothetical protein BCh11DRAFT_06431 [Burkholderia sp. Ch1-1]|nr:hypothetical protein BCh11DRAFT_06431 [Burkholderia sp. Ch1-1]